MWCVFRTVASVPQVTCWFPGRFWVYNSGKTQQFARVQELKWNRGKRQLLCDFVLLYVNRVCFWKISRWVHANHIRTSSSLLPFSITQWMGPFVLAKILVCKCSLYLGLLSCHLTPAVLGGPEALGHKDIRCTRGLVPLQQKYARVTHIPTPQPQKGQIPSAQSFLTLNVVFM